MRSQCGRMGVAGERWIASTLTERRGRMYNTKFHDGSDLRLSSLGGVVFASWRCWRAIANVC